MTGPPFVKDHLVTIKAESLLYDLSTKYTEFVINEEREKAEFDAFKQDLEVAKNTIQVVSYKMDLQEKMMTNDRIEEKIKAIEDENDPS